MTPDTLKACPFCGDCYPRQDFSVPDFEAVECLVCGCWAPSFAAWNHRAPLPSDTELVRAALTLARDVLGLASRDVRFVVGASDSAARALKLIDRALSASAQPAGAFVPYSTDERGYPHMELDAQGRGRLLCLQPTTATSGITVHGAQPSEVDALKEKVKELEREVVRVRNKWIGAAAEVLWLRAQLTALKAQQTAKEEGQ